jgi:hypothetical protein
MAKDNVEQQNEERNVKLDEMLKTLQKAKEEEQESQQRLEASDKLNYALQERGNELNFAQANAINELLDSMNSEGQDAEQRKEDTARAEKLLDLLGDIANNTEDLGKIDGPLEGGFAGILSLPGLLIGLAAGVVVGIADSFRVLAKLLSKGLFKAVGGIFKTLNKIPFVKAFTTSIQGFMKSFTGSIGGYFKSFKSAFSAQTTKIGKTIANTFKPLTNGIKNLKAAFKAGFAGLKTFRTAAGTFGKLGLAGSIGKAAKSMSNGIKSIGGVVASIKNFVIAPFQAIPKALAPLKALGGGGGGKMMKSAMDVIKRVMTVMRSVTKAAFGFGRVLGRLFLPITIIMSVFDTFKGALSGFDKYKDKGLIEGIIGGAIGGISGLLTGLIGMPLDLLKSGVSWIASKLGFENFSEQLDAFSFSDMISNLFTSITDTIVGFIGSIKDSIADIGIGATIANVALEMLKIFKKIATFPLAVAAGAVAGLAAAWPGGDSPGEAFMKGFNKVQSFGDAQIDSMKIQGDGMTESGEEIKQTSAENAQLQASNNANAAANVTAAAINNSKSSSSVTTNVNMSPQNRTAATVAGPYG